MVGLAGRDIQARQGRPLEDHAERQMVRAPDEFRDLKKGTMEGIKKQLGLKE
jgi:hypothetical protein